LSDEVEADMAKETIATRGHPVKVKSGSSIVTISNTPKHGQDHYTVIWHEAGLRKRIMRTDWREAKTEAKTVADRLNSGRGAALELTGKDRDIYLFAVSKLKSLQVPLNVAVEEFVAAKKIGVPLLAAAKFYHETHSTKFPDKGVSAVVAEFLAAKRADGRSVRYLQDCKARLERFSRDFKVSLRDVRTQELDAWLRGLKLSPRTRNNFRTVICSLFSFARDAGYLAKGKPTEAETTAVAKQDEGDIVIFTPAEFSTLLNAADAHLLPFLVFGGMAGLRSAEILRLKWENVNWPESVIEIQGKVAKTGTRRLAPLVPAAAAWLRDFKSTRGPVIGAIKLYERLEKLSESTKVPWKQNALRHSFCSYRMATLKDAPRVSYEAGNSVRIIQRHYDKVVTESQGKAWFSIMPKGAGNVVPITEAA
jgi:integrase